MNDIYQIYSPNSLTGQISSLIQGCSDTTIYVITIYFSSVSIKKTHYTVYVGLLTDLITFVLAIILGLKFL
jgi:spore maturation protein B